MKLPNAERAVVDIDKLRRGQVGTVVEPLTPDVFEVEFTDNDGRTFATLALRAK